MSLCRVVLQRTRVDHAVVEVEARDQFEARDFAMKQSEAVREEAWKQEDEWTCALDVAFVARAKDV
jgi:hypothetical protein